MQTVTSIVEYRNREIIEALESLLRKARSGEVSGMAYAVKISTKKHGMGIAGDYCEQPHVAACVVGQLFASISDRARNDGLILKEGP